MDASSETATSAARDLISSRGADCYSVNVEEQGCKILLKRRLNKSKYLTVGRIAVDHASRGAVEIILQKALGWKTAATRRSEGGNEKDQVHAG